MVFKIQKYTDFDLDVQYDKLTVTELPAPTLSAQTFCALCQPLPTMLQCND